MNAINPESFGAWFKSAFAPHVPPAPSAVSGDSDQMEKLAPRESVAGTFASIEEHLSSHDEAAAADELDPAELDARVRELNRRKVEASDQIAVKYEREMNQWRTR